MQPIHELLDRIRWDQAFARGVFVIAWYDRVDDRLLETPLSEIVFEPGDHFAFTFVDEDGATHSVPLHRIRAVYRDGECIWQRSG